MKIDWHITKTRGNNRPVLTYTVILEEHEKALALPPLRVPSTIPEPPDAWQTFCYPGQLERAQTSASDPVKYYDLDIPSHKGRSWQQTLRLPWRADNHYPEVEASFRALRDAFERHLAEAYASQPMNESDSLEISPAVQRHIAPAVLGSRFLQFAKACRDDRQKDAVNL